MPAPIGKTRFACACCRNRSFSSASFAGFSAARSCACEKSFVRS